MDPTSTITAAAIEAAVQKSIKKNRRSLGIQSWDQDEVSLVVAAAVNETINVITNPVANIL